MRTTRILATVAAVVLIGSAPASSLNVPRAHAEICAPPERSAISLVGSQGAFGVVVISTAACRQ